SERPRSRTFAAVGPSRRPFSKRDWSFGSAAMERGPDHAPPVGDDSPTLAIPLEYFALVCSGLYVEMHDSRRVGWPLHPKIVRSCVTNDISYAVYLRDELRRWNGLDSLLVRVDLMVTEDTPTVPSPNVPTGQPRPFQILWFDCPNCGADWHTVEYFDDVEV